MNKWSDVSEGKIPWRRGDRSSDVAKFKQSDVGDRKIPLASRAVAGRFYR